MAEKVHQADKAKADKASGDWPQFAGILPKVCAVPRLRLHFSKPSGQASAC